VFAVVICDGCWVDVDVENVVVTVCVVVDGVVDNYGGNDNVYVVCCSVLWLCCVVDVGVPYVVGVDCLCAYVGRGVCVVCVAVLLMLVLSVLVELVVMFLMWVLVFVHVVFVLVPLPISLVFVL